MYDREANSRGLNLLKNICIIQEKCRLAELCNTVMVIRRNNRFFLKY